MQPIIGLQAGLSCCGGAGQTRRGLRQNKVYCDMAQITQKEAATQFPRLLEEVGRGEEFVITQGSHPLARLSPVALPRQPGSARGIITYAAEDFDAPLDDLQKRK